MIKLQKLSQTKKQLHQLQDIFKIQLQNNYTSDNLNSIIIELSIDNTAYIQQLFQQIFAIIEQYEEFKERNAELQKRLQSLIDDNYKIKEKEQSYRDIIEELEDKVREIGIKSSSNGKKSFQSSYQTLNSPISNGKLFKNISKNSTNSPQHQQHSHKIQAFSQQNHITSQNKHDLAALLQYYRYENLALNEQIKLKNIQIQLAMIVIQQQRSKYVKIYDYDDIDDQTPLKQLFKSNSFPSFTSSHRQQYSYIIKQHSLMQDFIQSHLEYKPNFQDHVQKQREFITQQTSQSNYPEQYRASGRTSKQNSVNMKIRHDKATSVDLQVADTRQYGIQVNQKHILNRIYCQIYKKAITNRIKT